MRDHHEVGVQQGGWEVSGRNTPYEAWDGSPEARKKLGMHAVTIIEEFLQRQ